MTLLDAVIADQNGDLPSSAVRYEELLADGQITLETLLNLATMYWQATDPGMAAAKKLPPDFLAIAGRRCPELLTQARERFPTSTEARFLSGYIAWAELGEPFGAEECRELLREDPTVLLPAMHLFALSDGEEAEPQARELLRRSKNDGTTGARYVGSVIAAVLKRAGR